VHLGGQDRDTGQLADLPGWEVCSLVSKRVQEITTVSTCLVLLLVKVLTNGLSSCRLVYVGAMTLFGHDRPIPRLSNNPSYACSSPSLATALAWQDDASINAEPITITCKISRFQDGVTIRELNDDLRPLGGRSC